MNRTLQVELPEHIYELLVEAAEKAGEQPETLAAQLVANTVQSSNSDDPFAPFIGAIPTEKWADRHDELLGQNLLEEMTARKVDDTD